MSGGNSGADCEVIRGDGVGEFLFILGEHLTVDDGGNFSFKIQCAENGEVCAGEVRTCCIIEFKMRENLGDLREMGL